MSTPEERFELAKITVDMVVLVGDNLAEIGVWSSEDYKACQTLIKSLYLGMKVLDPEGYAEYYKKWYDKLAAKGAVAETGNGSGLYL